MNYPALRTVCAATAACFLLLTGCSSKPRAAQNDRPKAGTSQPPAEARGSGASDSAVFANQLANSNGAAGAPARLRVVQLEVYHLKLPLGAVSRSDEFWKHVDEQRVDVGTYDLLRKNGWRVGIAPTDEWPYFRDIIDGYPAFAKPEVLSVGPAGANGSLELSMRDNVPYQNIFYFTDENVLLGRTYERCENLVSITVQQAPRKPGEARVTVCPTVRALYRRFEVTSGEEGEREVRYVHPERLYDLNCQVDLPAGHFLVIAPSPEVRWKTSLGATFLVQDAASEQLEQVLLMVPRIAELEEVPAAPATPARP